MIIHYILLFLIAGFLSTNAKAQMITNYSKDTSTGFIGSNIQHIEIQPLNSDNHSPNYNNNNNSDNPYLNGTNIEIHLGLAKENGFGGSLFYSGVVFNDSVKDSQLNSGGIGARLQYNWQRLNLNTSMSWNRVFHQIKIKQAMGERYNPSWEHSDSTYHKYSLGLGFAIFKSKSLLINIEAQKNLVQFMDSDFAYHAPNTSKRMEGNTYGIRFDFLAPFNGYSASAPAPYYAMNFNSHVAHFIMDLVVHSLLHSIH